MKQEIISKSFLETLKIGNDLGLSLKGHEIILFQGDLGAGKTVFSKGVAQALNISPEDVVSPTYTFMNLYEGKFKLVHVDLYRHGDKIFDLPELEDYLGEAIILIEWAQFIPKSYFDGFDIIEIVIDKIDENNRKISIKKNVDK